MRFTVVATGQFSLNRAFGFGLAASSLLQLSVVISLIRPAGLAPAWHPASPAHTRIPKQTVRKHGLGCRAGLQSRSERDAGGLPAAGSTAGKSDGFQTRNTGLVSPVNPAPSGTVSLPYIGGSFDFGVRVKGRLY